MDAPNIYDDPEFLAGYVTLDRQVRGLDGAPEWPSLRAMLPAVADIDVVDLGCGFGWFARWAAGHGASSVLATDSSTAMLDRARADSTRGTINYRLDDLEHLVLESNSADLVFSSLALHYVVHLDRLLATVAEALRPGGSLVFSVEHPIYSAPSSQTFEISDAGEQIWPLNNYLVEGRRVTHWFVDGVVKHHRTVASWVNAVIGAGLVLDRIEEWGPTDADIADRPELAEDHHRPWFLLIAATKRERHPPTETRQSNELRRHDMTDTTGRDLRGRGSDAESELTAHLIEMVATRDEPVFVGIDGRSGSGKSTLAAAVRDGLSHPGTPSIAVTPIAVTVIDGDGFYSGGTGARWDRRSPQVKVAKVIDWRRQRVVLERLRQAGVAEWHEFDWQSNDWDREPPPLSPVPTVAHVAPIVILDGAYSCRPELREYLDVRVLLSVPADVRRRRLVAREGAGYHDEWFARWSAAEDFYFGSVMTPDRFDLVISAAADA